MRRTPSLLGLTVIALAAALGWRAQHSKAGDGTDSTTSEEVASASSQPPGGHLQPGSRSTPIGATVHPESMPMDVEQAPATSELGSPSTPSLPGSDAPPTRSSGAAPPLAEGASQTLDSKLPTDEAPATPEVAPPLALPRLVELGAETCVSCRAMIPVLAELRAAYASQLQVDFVDVWKFPDMAKPYEIQVIPTQIFLGPDGTELARHTGFYATEAIEKRWAELGYPLRKKTL